MKLRVFCTAAAALIFLLPLKAQFSEIQIDSLWNIFNNEALEEEIRAEAMLELIWDRHFSTDISLYDLALKLNKLEIAQSDKYQGVINIMRGYAFLGGDITPDPDIPQLNAEQSFMKSIDLLEKVDYPLGLACALNGMGRYYQNHGNREKSMHFFEMSLAISEPYQFYSIQGYTNTNIGNILRDSKDHQKCMDYYTRGKVAFEKARDKMGNMFAGMSMVYYFRNRGQYQRAIDTLSKLEILGEGFLSVQHIEIIRTKGDIHRLIEQFPQALEYYKKSLAMAQEIDNSWEISVAHYNLGVTYSEAKDFDKALYHADQSLAIAKKLNNLYRLSFAYYLFGEIYLTKGDYKKSIENFSESLELEKKQNSDEGQAYAYAGIAECFLSLGDFKKAIENGNRAYELFNGIGLVIEVRDVSEILYKANNELGMDAEAFRYLEVFSEMSDSIKSTETSQILQQQEFESQKKLDSLKQIEKLQKIELAHQREVFIKDRNRNLAIGSGIFFLLLAGGIYSRLSYIRKSKAVIEKEKERSEDLLLNILPAEIAEELKLKGSADARDFELVSVLFTDFIGFTNISENLSAKELVAEINHCFKAFDHICEKYDIEKIKTIGDAYMAAGGLPAPSENSVKNTVQAAIEMAKFIEQRKKEREANSKVPFEMRVGIHSGNVVAGIVGVRKFQYDVWGDTVNTASRMESNGEVGKVNISQSTYELLKNDPDFKFESRGKIEVKGKGKIDMYFVSLLGTK